MNSTAIMLIPLALLDPFAIGSILATEERRPFEGQGYVLIVVGVVLTALSVGMTSST